MGTSFAMASLRTPSRDPRRASSRQAASRSPLVLIRAHRARRIAQKALLGTHLVEPVPSVPMPAPHAAPPGSRP